MHLRHYFYTYAQGWLNMLVSIATIVAAIYGAVSLNAWREQMHVAADIETARKLLTAVVRTYESLNAIRTPFFSEKDGDERTRMESRWQTVFQTMSELTATSIEAEILWGESARRILDDFYTIVWNYRIALNAYWRYPEESRGQEPVYKTIYETSDDKYKADLDKSFKSIKEYVAPRMHRQKYKAVK